MLTEFEFLIALILSFAVGVVLAFALSAAMFVGQIYREPPRVFRPKRGTKKQGRAPRRVGGVEGSSIVAVFPAWLA